MQTITTRELRRMQDRREDFELINVLPEESYREAHIPGSLSIPLNDANFVEAVKRTAGSKDRRIVVYCASETCDASPKAAEKLEQAGFSNVADYEGGVKQWQEAGLPLEGAKAAAP